MPRRNKFHIDLNVREGHEGYLNNAKCPAPLGMKEYHEQERTWQGRPTLTVAQQSAITAKKQKAAMSIATKPGQQIFMQAFMLWMSGNQLNMFSINVTSMAILTPITAIFGIDQAFSRFSDVDLQIPKLIFIALNLVFLGIGLYKMSSMRLLPTTSADWTSKIVWKDMMETSSVPPDNLLL